jgi:hypothetical protein
VGALNRHRRAVLLTGYEPIHGRPGSTSACGSPRRLGGDVTSLDPHTPASVSGRGTRSPWEPTMRPESRMANTARQRSSSQTDPLPALGRRSENELISTGCRSACETSSPPPRRIRTLAIAVDLCAQVPGRSMVPAAQMERPGTLSRTASATWIRARMARSEAGVRRYPHWAQWQRCRHHSTRGTKP